MSQKASPKNELHDNCLTTISIKPDDKIGIYSGDDYPTMIMQSLGERKFSNLHYYNANNIFSSKLDVLIVLKSTLQALVTRLNDHPELTPNYIVLFNILPSEQIAALHELVTTQKCAFTLLFLLPTNTLSKKGKTALCYSNVDSDNEIIKNLTEKVINLPSLYQLETLLASWFAMMYLFTPLMAYLIAFLEQINVDVDAWFQFLSREFPNVTDFQNKVKNNIINTNPEKLKSSILRIKETSQYYGLRNQLLDDLLKSIEVSPQIFAPYYLAKNNPSEFYPYDILQLFIYCVVFSHQNSKSVASCAGINDQVYSEVIDNTLPYNNLLGQSYVFYYCYWKNRTYLENVSISITELTETSERVKRFLIDSNTCLFENLSRLYKDILNIPYAGLNPDATIYYELITPKKYSPRLNDIITSIAM